MVDPDGLDGWDEWGGGWDGGWGGWDGNFGESLGIPTGITFGGAITAPYNPCDFLPCGTANSSSMNNWHADENGEIVPDQWDTLCPSGNIFPCLVYDAGGWASASKVDVNCSDEGRCTSNQTVNVTDTALPKQRTKLDQAVTAAMHVFVGGQVVGTGVGCGVGIVAGGLTMATETYPLAGATIPEGCVGGGMVGFFEALPYSTLGAIFEFGWSYWGH
jgi:hypothetical protein